MSGERNDPVLESLIPDPDQPEQQERRRHAGGDSVSLVEIGFLVAPYLLYWTATVLTSFVTERIGKLVAVEGEIAKDRVHAEKESVEEREEGKKASAAVDAAPRAALPKRSVFSILAAHYQTSGLTSFLRGAKLSLALLACTSVLDALLLVPLRRANRLLPEKYHLLLIPPYLAAATLPLRTIRNLLTTNYICGAADVPLGEGGEREKRSAAFEPGPRQQQRRQMRYHYSSVRDVWRRLRAELTLREQLTLGWQLDLCNRYVAIGLSGGLQQLLYAVRDRLGPQSVWLPAALVTLFAACTALHHPFTVLTLRLSLLVPPSSTEGGEEEGEGEEMKRGLRYRGVWDALQTIVREEGVGALFAGWYCPVGWQHLLPLLQAYTIALGSYARAEEGSA